MADNNNIDIVVSDQPLDAEQVSTFINDDKAGGQTVFIGTVRNHAHGKEVIRLDFEAFKPMAIKEMHKIAVQGLEKWDTIKIAIHHRVGSLDIGDVAVIIGVSAAHRGAAFDACRYAIGTLKETVPIWKREYYTDGNIWVAAHP